MSTLDLKGPLHPTPATEFISGFWPRILALIIDWIILAIPLEVFGWVYFDRLARIGDWGALVGIIVALPYFGIFGSSIGRGQTIGMRVCKIKIVDAVGKPISLPASLLRSAILWIPIALYGAALPYSARTAIGIALFFIAYFYLFNRRTRQSLHDLALGSVVVKVTTVEPIRSRIWRMHWAIASCCVIIGLIVSAFLTSRLYGMGPFPELLALQQQIESSGKVHQASVQAGALWSNGQTSHYLNIMVVWNGKPEDYQRAANDLAEVILKADPNVMKRDFLQISIRTEFNFGLASGNLSRSFGYSPQRWQQLVGSPAKAL